MNHVQMIITVNGIKKEVPVSTTIRDVIEDQPYQIGSLIAVLKPIEAIKKETREFELVTPRGKMGLKLNDSKYADLFREILSDIKGKAIRWQTSKVTAIGSFPTQIELSRDRAFYNRYDCFFALGGFDSRTSYLMIARQNHEGIYGAAGAIIGRITTGRHLLNELKEGEVILDIKPIIEELSERNAFVTDDLTQTLEDGMSVETYISIQLERASPVNSEHLLVITQKGSIPIDERTETYSACSQNLDVKLVPELTSVREPGMVTVRHEGSGQGRVYFYKTRRQLAPSHSKVGIVIKGMELLRLSPAGSKLTVLTEPRRVMVIGMTQIQGQEVLKSFGLNQVREGDTADDAIIVEQEPELTMEALYSDHIETYGVRPEKVNEILLDDAKAPHGTRYFRKMTGLDHKPIGTLKVHFTFEDMPMITFEGNYSEAGHLIPENEFKDKAMRGDIGITNMSRPNRGLIGVRLEPSEEFGPTGEERYGTNMVGKVTSSLDDMMKGLKEGDIVYVREAQEKEPPSKKTSKRAKSRLANSTERKIRGKSKGEGSNG
ncbi:MAG: methanogenesis marker 3 protein [Methanomassiliicoccales archaeon]